MPLVSFCFDLEVYIDAQVRAPVRPSNTQDHDAPGFSDPGDAGEVEVRECLIDDERISFESLPAKVREKIEERAFQQAAEESGG